MNIYLEEKRNQPKNWTNCVFWIQNQNRAVFILDPEAYPSIQAGEAILDLYRITINF